MSTSALALSELFHPNQIPSYGPKPIKPTTDPNPNRPGIGP